MQVGSSHFLGQTLYSELSMNLVEKWTELSIPKLYRVIFAQPSNIWSYFLRVGVLPSDPPLLSLWCCSLKIPGPFLIRVPRSHEGISRPSAWSSVGVMISKGESKKISATHPARRSSIWSMSVAAGRWPPLCSILLGDRNDEQPVRRPATTTSDIDMIRFWSMVVMMIWQRTSDLG